MSTDMNSSNFWNDIQALALRSLGEMRNTCWLVFWLYLHTSSFYCCTRAEHTPEVSLRLSFQCVFKCVPMEDTIMFFQSFCLLAPIRLCAGLNVDYCVEERTEDNAKPNSGQTVHNTVIISTANYTLKQATGNITLPSVHKEPKWPKLTTVMDAAVRQKLRTTSYLAERLSFTDH